MTLPGFCDLFRYQIRVFVDVSHPLILCGRHVLLVHVMETARLRLWKMER